MAGGRPTDYDPVYCERVIELGNIGASVVEMAYEIGVCRATLETNWPAAHPEFLEAFTFARMASQVWWERSGRTGMTADKFNGSVWSRSMAARFPEDWRDKTETDVNIKGDLAEIIGARRAKVTALNAGD